ncbi:hypothetical protein KUTeg_001980 [Tegillarca granosa]|uniref:Uncharacterized protein n=1 Tax=Tegillarca granosa TaxID=220873 RepID=A0ABQ9FT07_TEGGR|nr:hypothetical protein KUTeg_001980 [Tegillarca granosa]
MSYRDGYQISSMPGSAILEYWPEQFGNSNDGVPDIDVKKRSAENFGHNIGNPNLWKTRFKHNNENVTQKSLTRETTQKRKTLFEPNHRKSTRRKACSVLRSQSLVLDHQNDICMCRGYHSHTYFKPEFFQSVKSEPSLDFEISIAKTRDELIAANDRHLNICNTFWRPSLSMNQYIHGDPAVEFDTLWPDNSSLKDLLQDGIQNTALRAAISDMTYISVICGPPYMIKCYKFLDKCYFMGKC